MCLIVTGQLVLPVSGVMVGVGGGAAQTLAGTVAISNPDQSSSCGGEMEHCDESLILSFLFSRRAIFYCKIIHFSPFFLVPIE